MPEIRNPRALAVAIALFGASVFAAQGVLRAREDGAGVEYAQVLRTSPAELAGKVLYTDGETPAAGAAVKVWAAAAKAFIHQTAASETGGYRLPRLEPGQYLIVFADRVTVSLEVSNEAEPLDGPLNVIIPRGSAHFARMEPRQQEAVLTVIEEEGEGQQADDDSAPGGDLPLDEDEPLRTVLIVGGGTVTAVGAVVTVRSVTEDDDDDRKVVSP